MSIFRSDGNFIYLDAPYCEFYIPMYYFDSGGKFATDLGDTIEVFGIFNVGIFDNGKLKDVKTFNIPSTITINVYDSEYKELTLGKGEPTAYKVIKYIKGAKIMQAVRFEDDGMSKTFLKFLTSGKIPDTIPYSKALQVWRKNQRINGVNLGVTSCYLEVVLATIYRNPDNLSEKFSKIASNDGVGDFDYKTASIRQICQYSSTYSAITFEDFDSMLTTSINKNRDKIVETESPVEKVIKF